MNNTAKNGSIIGMKAEDSENNTFAGNWLKENALFDANDNRSNNWDDDAKGNYYQSNNCTDSQSDGICDTAYSIPGGDN